MRQFVSQSLDTERHMARPEITGRKYSGKRAVAARYDGKSTRTIDRWVKAGILPKPDLIVNGRPLWADEALDRHDRQAVVARAPAKDQPTGIAAADQS
jgi:hypothetical protein